MARIKFLSDQVFESEGPGKGPQFAKDSVLDASDVASALGRPEVTPEYAESFLRRWVQRGVAAYDDGDGLHQALAGAESDAPTAGIPDDWRTYNAEDTKALAALIGATESDVRTKTDAVAYIEAELARRAAANPPA